MWTGSHTPTSWHNVATKWSNDIHRYMFGIYGEVSNLMATSDCSWKLLLDRYFWRSRRHISKTGTHTQCESLRVLLRRCLRMFFPCTTGQETDGCPLYSHPANLKDNKNCVLCFTCLRACPHRNVPLGSILFNGLVVPHLSGEGC